MSAIQSVAGLVIAALCARSTVASAQQSPRAQQQTPPGKYAVVTNEEFQPTALPALPVGMTVEMLVQGDRIFHGKGGCFACHGTEGQGLPAAGDAITNTLSYARHEWTSIDSLIAVGLPDVLTRSPIAMPARGSRGDLSPQEIQRVAAYVWAISGVRGEPWAGGHSSHQDMAPAGSTKGTAGPALPKRSKP
ncbi:MAG: cytochrome c [Gemmatimonadaceae bacterium]